MAEPLASHHRRLQSEECLIERFTRILKGNKRPPGVGCVHSVVCDRRGLDLAHLWWKRGGDGIYLFAGGAISGHPYPWNFPRDRMDPQACPTQMTQR